MRFDRQFLDAKRRFEEGELGSLIALESFYLHDMRPIYEFTPWRLHMPQDFMFGGCVHSIDVIRAFGGDIKRVHAIANKGGLTPDYPIRTTSFLTSSSRRAPLAACRASTELSIAHADDAVRRLWDKGQPARGVHRQ